MNEKRNYAFHTMVDIPYEQTLEKVKASLVLPCNVIMYDEEGKTAITVANPVAMIATLGDPRLVNVARDAKDRLVRMVDNL